MKKFDFVGTVTACLLALIGFVAVSFDARLTSAWAKIEILGDDQHKNEADIMVMKEILSQVNRRTYDMEKKIDRILEHELGGKAAK